MTGTALIAYTCFDGYQRIASGPLPEVALMAKRSIDNGSTGPVLIFADATGHSIDIDTYGSTEALMARLAEPISIDANPVSTQPGLPLQTASELDNTDSPVDKHRERGRPKLGVVAREVTLLPRHWEWLATQPGGASVALRKLVEEARRANREKDRIRTAQERAYRFMSALAGDLPGFEEATRALFANDRQHFGELVAIWASDVRDYAIWLAFGDDNPVSL